MTDNITLTGLVATIPRHLITGGSLPITSFRLASTQRRFDRAQNRWVDAETNWYTVTAFRQLALNAAGSLQKGDRVVVTGRLKLREWQAGESKGLNIEVEAEALGHDLAWGTAVWTRVPLSASARSETAGEDSPQDASGWASASPDSAGRDPSSPALGSPPGNGQSVAESHQSSDDRLSVPF